MDGTAIQQKQRTGKTVTDIWIDRRQALLARSISGYMAALSTGLGLGLMLMWIVQPQWIQDNIPILYQSKFNTALGIFVSGLGLWALIFNRPWLVRMAALAVGMLALLTLLQVVTGLNLGIDELVIGDHANSGRYPGRPSITTAINLAIISGVTLLCLSSRSDGSRRLASTLLVAQYLICLAAFGGYLQHIPLAYSWGDDMQISPQALCGFLALASGHKAHLWLNDPRGSQRIPVWVPVAYGALIFWFDISTPHGIATAVAYVPLVFFALGFPRPVAAFVIAGAATVLSIIGYFVTATAAAEHWVVLVNHALSIGAVWFTSVIVYIGRTESLGREAGELQMHAIVDTVLDGVITIDTRGLVLSFNPAAVRIFGYDADEVIGKNIKMLMPEPYHSAHDGYLEAYARTRKPAIMGVGREVTARRKDGSIFPMELGVAELPVPGERTYVGTIRDISARRQAEEEIARYVQALQRSNQDLDEFAYIASHDLKEPLRGLSTNARFLEEDFAEQLGAAGKRRIHRLIYLSNRMEALVDDLLHFSRLGRQELAVKPVDLNLVIADIANLMATTLAEVNARIIVPAPLPTIVCDAPRVTELFRNLISNGVKYNDKAERIIEVRSRTEGGETIFSVTDNGIGIPEEFHEEIFRIFKRLNSEDDTVRGTGVGLTFVRKIIERHRGRIWLQSTPGEGTTFFFTLQTSGQD